MKHFLRGVVKWKMAACATFTAVMILYLFFCLLFDTRQVSTVMLWTLFLASAAASLIQAVCFSDWVIKKMRYTWRSLLFVLLFLPALTLAAWLGEWFPMERAGAWAMFIGMFLLTFVVMTIGFDIYFRFTGRKYDGLLGQYRREQEKKGK